MKSIIHKIAGALGKFTMFLTTFGAFGLFAIAFLDSVMVPLPGGVDAVMLLLSASRPAWMLVYAAAATIGSTLGCLVLYYISMRAGHRALARFSEAKKKRVKDLIDRYDVLSVLVASLCRRLSHSNCLWFRPEFSDYRSFDSRSPLPLGALFAFCWKGILQRDLEIGGKSCWRNTIRPSESLSR